MADYICCIYAIKNMSNGKVYIGKTRDFKTRKTQHLTLLKLNNHNSHMLQADYNNGDEIQFRIIRRLPTETTDKELFEAERAEILNYNACEAGYNTLLPKTFGLNACQRSNRYRAEKRDRLTCDFPKGTKERYRKYAEEQGYRSLTAMFIDLVERDMKEKAGE